VRCLADGQARARAVGRRRTNGDKLQLHAGHRLRV